MARVTWDELPDEFKEQKINELQEELIEEERGHTGDSRNKIMEAAGWTEEEYIRHEVWPRSMVERHIKNHFPVIL